MHPSPEFCVLNSESSIVKLQLMALGRFSTNLVFGVAVIALGVTAGVSLYLNLRQPGPQAQAAETGRLPEQHPPIDIANRITALQQMIAKEPQNPEYPAQIGNIYYDLGRYDKAAEYYQQSLNIRPRDPNVETDLATCFHYMGQDDKSLELLNKVLAYNPGFAQAKYNKGTVLIEGKKDVKGGISVWEDLLRSDPGYSRRAELEQRINQLKASIR
jgi:cytochrome c-type biogenesis protein CcmH/NrfG